MPQIDALKRYIAWKAWDQQQFGAVSRAARASYNAELSRASVKLTPDTKVLEIGFGNGEFAGYARQITQQYVGTESNPELIERAIQIGIEAHQGDIDLKTVASGRQFDLIVAFDVLEHLEIEEIITLLRSASHCLADNGTIFFRVPSGDSPFSGRIMYGDITHRTLLGSEAIYQLALITGLEVTRIDNSTLPISGISFITLIKNIIVLLARKLIEIIIRLIFNGNKRTVIASNMIVTLSKLKTRRS